MSGGVICVVGPTASGKTALSVALAKALDGEVISCDSMQIYRGMDIGTAKPTDAEMQGIPHHMLSVADPTDDFSAGKYAAMADPILQDILRRGKTAIVCGGTGLYMDALISGRTFAPHPADGIREAIEAEFDARGAQAMLQQLSQIDPAAAARLHPADRKRIVRALEIFRQTGETITEHDRKTRLIPPKYRASWIGLTYSDRAELYARIDARVDEMMRLGLENEVRQLLAQGVSPDATAMQAIGYKEIAAALRGETTMEDAAAQIKQGSRRYAKRQLTWFRRNEDVFWIDRTKNADFSAVLSLARQHLTAFGDHE